MEENNLSALYRQFLSALQRAPEPLQKAGKPLKTNLAVLADDKTSDEDKAAVKAVIQKNLELFERRWANA